MKDLDSIGFSLASVAAMVCLSVTPGLAQAPAAKKVAAEAKPASPGGPGSLDGVWFSSSFSRISRGSGGDAPTRAPLTADGKPAPLQPWAEKVVAERVQAARDGHPFPQLSSTCIPNGLPGMMAAPGPIPIEVLENPELKQITILFEELTTWRVIRMNQKHRDDPIPSLFGDFIGHWEGDTLVVDTTALSDITSIEGFIPHSEDLHIVEWFHHTSPDTLEVRTRVEDPKAFTAPFFIATRNYKRVPGEQIEEWTCINNRNKPDENGKTSVQLK